MTELKSVQIDPYDAVLSDLRTKRQELDSAIQMLEKLRDGRLGVIPAVAPQVEPTAEAGVDGGAFLGMSIVDAAKKLLKLRKKAMTNSEILKDLVAGGVVLTGADPLNVVGSVLTRRFNQNGDVVRVARGTWGLKEWYPNRTFKPSTIPPGRESDATVSAQNAIMPSRGVLQTAMPLDTGPDPEGDAAYEQWKSGGG